MTIGHRWIPLLLSLNLGVITACPGDDGDDVTHPSTSLEPSPSGSNPTPTEAPSPAPALEGCGVPYTGPEPVVEQDGRFEIIQDFPSAYLDQDRDIRVYLPQSYGNDPGTPYPVLYMHDGQNLFDAATAAFGVEWQIDENVDTLVDQDAMNEIIVVGIDNTSDRTDEYTPTTDPVYGGGDGDLYARFIIDELKPYIDSHYLTACGPEYTAVMGSSLGGLISCYMGWNYSDTFGMAGCVSPSFWWDDEDFLQAISDPAADVPACRFWIDIGTGEGDDEDGDGLADPVLQARSVCDEMIARGLAFETSVGYLEVEGGVHDEASWAARVANPLLFFFGTDRFPDISSLDLVTYGDQVGLTGTTNLHLEVNDTYTNDLEMTVPNALAGLEVADTEVATVSADGVITGIAPGTTTISATYRGLSDQATIQVVDSLSETVTITFLVTVPENTPEGDTIYVAGDLTDAFGGYWDPAGRALDQADTYLWTTTFDAPRGTTFSFKFTRGSWDTVEKNADGSEMANRTADADADSTLEYVVARWADVP